MALFIPWYDQVPLKRAADSWEDHFQIRSPHLSPRIRRHIFNIDLLHKSKEESRFDRMQREARQGGSGPFMDDFDLTRDSDDDDDEDSVVLLPLAETVGDAHMLSLESMDFYTHEAIDASHESGCFDAPMSAIVPDAFPILPKVGVAHALRLLDADDVPPASRPHIEPRSPQVPPTVFVSDLDGMRDDAVSVADGKDSDACQDKQEESLEGEHRQTPRKSCNSARCKSPSQDAAPYAYALLSIPPQLLRSLQWVLFSIKVPSASPATAPASCCIPQTPQASL